MIWVTLEEAKQQLRIDPDFTLEDQKIQRYIDSAEETILNVTGRTVDELKAMNKIDQTKIPSPIWEATVMLVDLSYQQSNPMSMQQLYLVPYSFDMKLKPYIKLTTE